MTEELLLKQRLQGLQRVLRAGHQELALQLIEAIVDEIDLKVEQFEQELEYRYVEMDDGA